MKKKRRERERERDTHTHTHTQTNTHTDQFLLLYDHFGSTMFSRHLGYGHGSLTTSDTASIMCYYQLWTKDHDRGQRSPKEETVEAGRKRRKEMREGMRLEEEEEEERERKRERETETVRQRVRQRDRDRVSGTGWRRDGVNCKMTRTHTHTHTHTHRSRKSDHLRHSVVGQRCRSALSERKKL